ncbi:MAG: hypothetical protein ACFFEE_00595 [Candidatus Thorarchaeota archaeon]
MTESTFKKMEQIAKQALTKLDLPKQTHTRCLSILNNKRAKEILSERNVDGIIAGAIYIAAIQTENRLPQHRIADVMAISETTIRRYYVMIVKALGIYEKRF